MQAKKRRNGVSLFFFALSGIAILFLFSGCGGGAIPGPIGIQFGDAVLEQAVRNAVGYTGAAVGPIFPEDVLGIIGIDASGEESAERGKGEVQRGELTSLVGIEYLTNLQWLDICFNQVQDLTPLANLANLDWLSFDNNLVESIAPLANLTNLWFLKFWANNVSDISPLANLVNLEELYLDENQIADISVLAGKTSLERLGMGDNQITDVSALENLTNLIYLNSWGNNVSDISPLANLVNLLELHLEGNQVVDPSPIANLNQLEVLWLHWNQITDISALVENSGLGEGDEINLQNNHLDLTEGSQNMSDINTLIARGCDVTYQPQN